MSSSDSKHVSFTPLPEKEAVWTKLVKCTYIDPTGTQRTWESAERTTRPKDCDIDGVGIVAILEKETGPEIMLQKQYRPPLQRVCIEIPAGLIDAGETAEEAAIRELKEETGYIGKVKDVSPIMFNGQYYLTPRLLSSDSETCRACIVANPPSITTTVDPGFCNTNLRTVHMSVDMSLPENQNPKPQLEEEEFIEVFFLPLNTLFAECKRLESEGYAIDARIGTLAEGIEVAKAFKLT